MAIEIYLPKMSDHMERGVILAWLVVEGDPVHRGQVIAEIETDKAVGELEAPADGYLRGVRAAQGDSVGVGETIAFIAGQDEILPEMPPRLEPAGEDLPGVAPPPVPSTKGTPVLASPVARRVAKELGIDLARIHGTGPGGRITETDVRAQSQDSTTIGAGSAARATGQHNLALEGATGDQWLELNSIQRLTAERMQVAVATVPHFYLTVAADMSDVLRLQASVKDRMSAETGMTVSITAILVKAAAVALSRYPRANASFVEGRIRLYSQANVGVAVGTETGLVVPVIKAAGQKTVLEIAQELDAYRAKANGLAYAPDDLSGGTFTVTNLGMYGVDRFQAIINPPQAAILAVGRIIKTPVGTQEGTITLRPMMDMTLSVDHRCLDGLQASRFLVEVRQALESASSLA